MRNWRDGDGDAVAPHMSIAHLGIQHVGDTTMPIWCGGDADVAATHIAPDWRQALALKKNVEDRIARDSVIVIGITATAVGLLVGGIAAVVARKK